MHKVLHTPSYSHKERLLRLSEKLSEVKVNNEPEKGSRLRTIEQTLQFIEDNIFESQESFTKTLRILEDSISGVQKDVDEDKKEADVLISNELQDLTKFEQKLQDAYSGICQRRKEQETRITQLLDEKFGNVSIDIQAESSSRAESTKQLTQIYQSDFRKLKGNLNQAKSERESEDDKIENYMQSNLDKLADDINDLQKQAENSEKTIFNGIKTSVVDVKSLIDGQKRNRETAHEHMIKMLEDSYKNFKNNDD